MLAPIVIAQVEDPFSADVQPFNEGTLDILTGVWHCEAHGVSLNPGQTCAFCLVDAEGMEALEIFITEGD